MSGSHFDYNQYRIYEIIDNIEEELNNQGKEKPKDELYMNDEYYKKYPEEKYYREYSDIVQEKMRETVKALKIAVIYTNALDKFLSGDTSEESFIEELTEDLNGLK